MQLPDFNNIVETVLASLGGSPTSSEVEAAAMRLFESQHIAQGSTSKGIEAVQCSISLAECTSRRSVTQRSRVYDLIKKSADQLSEAVFAKTKHLGLKKMPRIELQVRDSSNLYAGHEPAELLSIAEAISDAISHTSISTIRGPFVDLSLPEEFAKIDLIPDLLSRFDQLMPLLQIGTEQDPLSEEVLEALAYSFGIASSRHSSDPILVALVVNGCDRRAFGHRLSPKIKGLSVAVSPESDAQIAVELGRLVSSTCLECYRFLEVEIRPSLPQNNLPRSTGNHVFPTALRHEGFPAFGSNSNRISSSGVYDPYHLVRLVESRLASFCYGSKEAGLVLEVYPS